MARPNVIEFSDDSGEIIVCKQPVEGYGEYTLGTQLIVQESQVAVFFRDGQALDGFKPGRHTLSVQNLPVVSKLLGTVLTGRSPFRSHVYFVATKTFTNLGWGTSSPVVFRDADFRMISLRAHGRYSIRVVSPRTFLMTLVGTRGVETTYAIEEHLRSIIVARLNETLAAILTSILDLPALYGQLSLELQKRVETEFAQYGLRLVDLLVEAITPPPEVREMINRASGMAVQDVQRYKEISAADALRNAASHSGTAGEGLGAGLGLGMGLAMAGQFSNQQGLSPPPVPNHRPDKANKLTIEHVKARLNELKQLEQEGLITATDFENQKQKLLSQL